MDISLTFPHVLQAKALIDFVLAYIFKDVCIANSFLEERDNVSLWSKEKFSLLCSVITVMSLSWQRSNKLMDYYK